jgi:hypothetical protein
VTGFTWQRVEGGQHTKAPLGAWQHDVRCGQQYGTPVALWQHTEVAVGQQRLRFRLRLVHVTMSGGQAHVAVLGSQKSLQHSEFWRQPCPPW